jgi:hypothetical protein
MFLSEAVTIDSQHDEEFNSDAMDGKLQRESKILRLGYKVVFEFPISKSGGLSM